MHFFSPAHMMPLVECIRAKESSPATIAAVMGVSKLLKKVGAVCKHEGGNSLCRRLSPGRGRKPRPGIIETCTNLSVLVVDDIPYSTGVQEHGPS